jgi:hypothetical protein
VDSFVATNNKSTELRKACKQQKNTAKDMRVKGHPPDLFVVNPLFYAQKAYVGIKS